MEKLLDFLKRNFLVVYSLGVWLFGLISPLVFLPTVFSRHFDPIVIKGISILLISALVVCFYIFLPVVKNRKRSRRYILLSVGLLLLSVMSLLFSIRQDRILTVENPSGSANYQVIGSNLLPEVKKMIIADKLDPNTISSSEILDIYPGDTSEIYFASGIELNSFRLLGMYFLVLLLFVSSILLISYAIYTHPENTDTV